MPSETIPGLTSGVAREIDERDVDVVLAIGITSIVVSTPEGTANHENVSSSMSSKSAGAIVGILASLSVEIGVNSMTIFSNVGEVRIEKRLRLERHPGRDPRSSPRFQMTKKH